MTQSDKHESEQPPRADSDVRKSSRRFRFKRKHSDLDRYNSDKSHGKHRKPHHDDHDRSKKRIKPPQSVGDSFGCDDVSARFHPDTAFRESLFDAMADDEGAAFWESVYGQPIHEYRDLYENSRVGELEQMDDESYAQFVRKRMWEKSWEGIEAAKEEKRQERDREKRNLRDDRQRRSPVETSRQQADDPFQFDIEWSLRRGERRRDRKRWKSIWEQYLIRWEELQAGLEVEKSTDGAQRKPLNKKIAWPVESGERKDINVKEVERFFQRCADTIGGNDASLSSILKSERVRWHPDKIQQRYGFMGIDDGTAQGVTAVFQILDSMWAGQRGER